MRINSKCIINKTTIENINICTISQQINIFTKKMLLMKYFPILPLQLSLHGAIKQIYT